MPPCDHGPRARECPRDMWRALGNGDAVIQKFLKTTVFDIIFNIIKIGLLDVIL